jgi:hypothetical protein
MASQYAIHGLRVRSCLELDAETVEGPDSDVLLELATALAVPPLAPPGRVLAEYGDEHRGFSIVEAAEDYALGIRGLLEARITRDFTRIRLTPVAGTAHDLLSTFAQGAVLATLLSLKGACVLHASAVEIGGKAVALVGPSGAGKSTLAAFCCAAGARLLTDDLLVVL